MPIGPITEMLQRASGTQVLDWSDALHTVEATDTPFLVLLPEGKKPTQVEGNWPASKIDVGAIEAVPDGQPVSAFAYQDRKPLKGVSQEVRAPWKVTKKAQFTETWGVKDEVTYQKAQALLRLRLMLERLFLSNQDCAREGVGGATADALRAVGKWLENDAGSLNAEFPIPAEFRVPAACKYTGAMTAAAFKDTTFEAMLKAAAEQRKKVVDLDLQASLGLQQVMADWTQHDPNYSSTNAALIANNIDAEKMKYLKKVEFFTFHAGYVRTHLNFNMFYDLSTGAPTTQTNIGGYALDMNNGWELRFMQQIMNEDLPNDGSGVKGYWSTIVMLCCMMPAGQLLIYPSA